MNDRTLTPAEERRLREAAATLLAAERRANQRYAKTLSEAYAQRGAPTPAEWAAALDRYSRDMVAPEREYDKAMATIGVWREARRGA